MNSSPIFRGLTLAVFFLLTGAAAWGAPGKQDPVRFERRELAIERAGGGTERILAELARTEEERARGLMHRKSLPDGQGMLFIFDRDEILSFWMKDTLIPLSIAFISYNGRLLEIRTMRPQDTSSIRSSRSARYALEVPQGWFDRVGVAVGDTLRLDNL